MNQRRERLEIFFLSSFLIVAVFYFSSLRSIFLFWIILSSCMFFVLVAYCISRRTLRLISTFSKLVARFTTT